MNRPQPETIRSMFSSIAGRYDRANSVLSFGIHHRWRTRLVEWSHVKPGDRVLDVATGTGDLAFAFREAVGEGGRVVGCDFCPEMLVEARRKSSETGTAAEFLEADAMALPFGDGEFDLCSISFGIRNVSDPTKALLELARVTRDGGSVLILEFGKSPVPVWGGFFDFYSRYILPRIGGFVTGRRQAYEYLQESSSEFPSREEFIALMASTGRFQNFEFESLSGGIAYLYRAKVRARNN